MRYLAELMEMILDIPLDKLDIFWFQFFHRISRAFQMLWHYFNANASSNSTHRRQIDHFAKPTAKINKDTIRIQIAVPFENLQKLNLRCLRQFRIHVLVAKHQLFSDRLSFPYCGILFRQAPLPQLSLFVRCLCVLGLFTLLNRF